MAHDHTHHNHSHHHHHLSSNINKAFIIGISLNISFVLIEVFYGFYSNSLALLSDAGHNFGDVISLALALLGFRLSKVKATQRFTYGYRKTTILVALGNAVLLLIAIGGIGFEATHRLIDGPHELKGNTIALVAGAGILINGVTALLFLRDKDKDLNIKGAYLHMAVDALVSAGVVVSGVLMQFTHWYWLDSATSYLIVVVIFLSTWNLLKDSLSLSLDAVPKNIDPEKVRNAILNTKGVMNVHHIHIWAISTTQNALTAHIVLKDEANHKTIKDHIKHELEHLNISHVTLETESESEECPEGSVC